MTAHIIDGKGFAERLRSEIATDVSAMVQKGARAPGLAVVLVGHDPASTVYVRNKEAATTAAGMKGVAHHLPAETTQADLLAVIDRLNQDPNIDGILVQLPLPAHIDAQVVIRHIAPDKDVDGFHPVNVAALMLGHGDGFVPCTPLGCLMLLRDYCGKGGMRGKNALVLGRSAIVGKPMAQLLLTADCTVTIAHSHSQNLPALCQQADILVAAVGRPEMVQGDWIKPGAIVIDVGINRIGYVKADGTDGARLVGDVAFASAKERAAAITPVPGGVGPMTIACLLANTLKSACVRQNLPIPACVSIL